MDYFVKINQQTINFKSIRGNEHFVKKSLKFAKKNKIKKNEKKYWKLYKSRILLKIFLKI